MTQGTPCYFAPELLVQGTRTQCPRERNSSGTLVVMRALPIVCCSLALVLSIRCTTRHDEVATGQHIDRGLDAGTTGSTTSSARNDHPEQVDDVTPAV